MYGIGVFFALRNAMKAFRPAAALTLDAPMTPERLLLARHQECARPVLRARGDADASSILNRGPVSFGSIPS